MSDKTMRLLVEKELSSVMSLEQCEPESAAWFSATEADQLPLLQKKLLYGVVVKNEIVGKMGFIDYGEEGFEVDGMIIHPNHRRQGLGRQLLSHAFNDMKTRYPKRKIFLFVYPKNTAAINLYKEQGFVETGFFPNKYGPGRDRFKMVEK